jgi:periplasmic protein CpxP/Spy
MKIIRSSHLASAAVVALLALPAAALAQPTQSPAPAAAASSPMTSQPVSGKNMEERVENHIKQLHAQLQITPAEQPQWDQFAQVMRENARDMDQAFMQRAQQYATMNAMQNMQSYEQMAEAHVRHLQKLVPAFDNLYNAMPEQQKKLTDQVFRANAERRAAQSRRGASATAK